jgi:hypothetical protein
MVSGPVLSSGMQNIYPLLIGGARKIWGRANLLCGLQIEPLQSTNELGLFDRPHGAVATI